MTTRSIRAIPLLLSLALLAPLHAASADEADTTPPVIDAPDEVVAEATGPEGASVAYESPPTMDDVDGPGVADCSPASGSTFPLGESEVTCSAVDAAGNAATASFLVRVVDTTPPTLATRASIDALAVNPAGIALEYEPPQWRDLVDGSGPATCAPAVGALFPLGNTTVTCTATDAAGNAAAPTSFVVRVKLQGAGTVAAERASYSVAQAATEGVRGRYVLTSADGTPLPDVAVTVSVIRQVQFVGYVDSTQFAGRTDADGVFAFDPGAQFELPTGYLLLATPSHPLLVGGNAAGRYVVTAT